MRGEEGETLMCDSHNKRLAYTTVANTQLIRENKRLKVRVECLEHSNDNLYTLVHCMFFLFVFMGGLVAFAIFRMYQLTGLV